MTRSPATGAERSRLYRRRHRSRIVKVDLEVEALDAMVKRGYLAPRQREDASAIAEAATAFISDALVTS